MKYKLLAISAVVAVFASAACQAATFDFDFKPSGTGGITASGTLTTSSSNFFADIVGITGEVNGVEIERLVTGINILHTTGFAAAFSFEDVNNEVYSILSFLPPNAFAESGSIETTGTLTVTPEVMSTVPLPASAPMFGAALLALAGIGYARHQRTKAKA